MGIFDFFKKETPQRTDMPNDTRKSQPEFGDSFGKCGNTAHWEYNVNNNTFLISGEGAIEKFENINDSADARVQSQGIPAQTTKNTDANIISSTQNPNCKTSETNLNKRIDYAKSALTLYFSQEIVDKAFNEFNMFCRIEGLRITAETDFGRRTTIAQAKDEDELLFNVIKELSGTCSDKYEQIHRDENSKSWRYLRSKVVNGHWMYTENVDYIYNTIEDTRKVRFEKHIGAMANIFSLQAVASMISEYTLFLNIWFGDQHWSFNTDLMEFIEISSSKERDTDNQEHPQPYEILE